MKTKNLNTKKHIIISKGFEVMLSKNKKYYVIFYFIRQNNENNLKKFFIYKIIRIVS